MNSLIRLGLRIASLPILDVKKRYPLMRKVQEAISKEEVELALEKTDYILFDDYLLSDDQEYHVPIRIFSPTKNVHLGIIIFFHGGGYVTGNVDTYTKTCLELAEVSRHIIFSVDYRLAPENPYPAAVNDCYTVAWEIANYFRNEFPKNLPNEFSKKTPIYLMGDSAGGNLAAVVSQLLTEQMDFQVDGQILLYPAVGNDYSDEFVESGIFPSLKEKGFDFGLTLQNLRDYYDLYLPDPNLLKTDPKVSPLLNHDFRGLPPTLLITAEHDLLRDEGMFYAQKLKDAGVKIESYIMPDVPHGFLTRSILFPEAHKKLSKSINDFLHVTEIINPEEIFEQEGLGEI